MGKEAHVLARFATAMMKAVFSTSRPD